MDFPKTLYGKMGQPGQIKIANDLHGVFESVEVTAEVGIYELKEVKNVKLSVIQE